MSTIRVIPSPAFGTDANLQPLASAYSIKERPPSRRLSSSPRLLSPRFERTSLDLERHSNKEIDPIASRRSLRRANTDPHLPSQRTLPWSEDAAFKRNATFSAGWTHKNQGATNFHKGGDLIGLVKAENVIREIVRRKYSDIKMAFQTMDDGKIGAVNIGDFRRVINAFCISLSDEHFDHLLMKIGATKDGMVNYIGFLEKFRIGPVMMSVQQRNIQTPPRTPDSLELIEAKLRDKLTSNFASFMKSVRLFDYNRDGHVQKNELKRILDSCGVKLQENQYTKLMQKYVISQNLQSVDYVDFLRKLGIEPKSADSRQGSDVTKNLFLDRPSNSKTSSRLSGEDMQGLTLAQIERKFREKIMMKFADLKRAFVAFDKNKDGYVTLDELRRVLVHFVFSLSDQMFTQLMERCGVRATHKIPYDHFLDKFRHPVEDGNGQTIPIKPSHKVNPIREALSPVDMKELWERLRNHIVNNYSSAKKAFLAFDDDKDGRVRRREFRKVLETFPFKLTEEQFNNLMYRVDPESKGYISYHEFLETFESKEGEGAHPWLHGERKINKTKPMAKMNRQMAEEVLREKLMDNWSTIGKAFMKVDENSDGFISKSELKYLLNRYHIPITEEHFLQLWKGCDENHDGKIQYQEFLKSLGVDITSGDVKGVSTRITDESEEKIQLMKTDQLSRLHVVSKNALTRTKEMTADDVISILKDHFIQRSADLRKTFLKYDYDGDGKLSKKEFRMTLQNLGLLMHDDQFKELTNRLGFYQGTMAYSDFVHKFEEIEKFGEGGKTLHMNNHRYNKVKERSESMTAEEVEEIMRKKISESFQTLRQAFYTVDSNHDAQITRPEFRRLLDMFMIPINDTEFDRLMTEKLQVAKNGTISYREFLRRFQQKENLQKGHPWLFSQQSPNTTYALKNLTAQEAHACLKQKAKDQWHDISMAFRAFDKDGNSIVTKEELKSVLHRFNIAIDKDEFKKLWRMYDIDRNGHVDHGEFLHRLGVELAPGDVHGVSNKITKGSEDEIYRHHHNQQMKQHKAAMNQANTTSFMSAMDVENKLRDKFRDNYASFRKAFEQVDTNKDGLISRSELMKVLYDQHFYMEDSELAVLLNRLGFGNKRSLNYVHFLSAFEDPRYAQNPQTNLDSRSSISSKVSFESAEELTPEEAIVRLRRTVAQNAEAIRSAFGAFDQSGSGRISIVDLHQIINSFCFKISQKQFKHLLSKMIVQIDNTVDYESFMESFQRTDTEASKKWLENMLKDIKSTSPRSTVKNSPPTYEVIEDQVAEMIRAKQKKIVKAFSDLDFNHNGTVTADSLRQILNEHTLKLSDDHFDQLWSKYDRNDVGSISYKDFLKQFAGVGNYQENKTNPDMSPRIEDTNNNKIVSPRRAESPTKDAQQNAVSSSDLEESIQQQILRHWKSVLKSCRVTDQSNSGEIQISKFKGLLENQGILLSDEEFSYITEKYEIDRTGRINYMELLKKYMIQSKEQKRETVTAQSFDSDNVFLNSLISRLRREIREEWKTMRRTFKAADRSGTGTCTAAELKQTLRKFKIGVTEEEFYHLMTYFDKQMTGKVSYNEFLKAVII